MSLLNRRHLLGLALAPLGACVTSDGRPPTLTATQRPPALGAELPLSQRVAAFLLADGNPTLVPLSEPDAIRDVGVAIVSPSCTDCWDFWRHHREEFMVALARMGVFSAIVPFPRVPSDEMTLAAIACADDPPAAFSRCMDELAQMRPRGATAAARQLAVARGAGNPDPACAGRSDVVRVIGLNRYFAERMLGVTEVPALVVGDRLWQGPRGIAQARRELIGRGAV